MKLPAKLTHDEAPELARSLARTMRSRSTEEGAGPWLLDASELRQFDSSALAVLLECRRGAAAAGRSVRVAHTPEKLRQLAVLYGIDDLLEMPAAPSAQR